MKFFNVDGPIYKFISRLVDVIVLNFWMILLCIPIVTAGASITAAFSITLKMAKDEEGHITKGFFKAFKENFKQGTILGFITIACIYIVYLNFEIFRYLEEENFLPFIIGIFAAAIFLISLIYAFPLIARYDNTIINTLKNSQRIALKYILRTLLIIVLIIVEVVLILFNTTTLFFGILIGPAFIVFTVSTISRNIFEKIEKDAESE